MLAKETKHIFGACGALSFSTLTANRRQRRATRLRAFRHDNTSRQLPSPLHVQPQFLRSAIPNLKIFGCASYSSHTHTEMMPSSGALVLTAALAPEICALCALLVHNPLFSTADLAKKAVACGDSILTQLGSKITFRNSRAPSGGI